MKKLCLFTFGIGMIAFLFAYSPISHAESGQTYEVGGSSVNVRSTPSHSAEIVGTLHEGDQIIVFQESFGWLQTYYDGETAWVASQYVTEVNNSSEDVSSEPAQTEAVSSDSITVQVTDARVRTGPGTENSVSGYAAKDHTYTLLESTDNWHKITLDNGETGWIASWLTDKSNGEPAAEDATNDDQQVASETTNNGSLSGHTVVLDPGHGGEDPGSIALDGTFEKEYTLRTAEKVAQKLQNSGANVIQTRTNDTFISLPDRVSRSVENDADAFISLHYNAYPTAAVNGFSSHYYDDSDSALAQDVQSGLTRNITLNSRGSMKSDYHVLRENSNPAILLELGFITNTNDLANIQTDGYQNAVGDGVTEGLLDYFQ